MSPKKIKAGAGPFSFEWENWMKDEKADPKRIKQIIDSWAIDIEIGGNDISCGEMESFFKVMRGYGHLARIAKDEEYLEKYKKIKKYFDSKWGGPRIHIVHMS